ncbi:MAG: hypothetical protein JWO85_3574 [Candidatus Eremiobacteraeota bacterium]|nr:hypothetical protein [Candidatus Eremiobacteraeota bacterium]
MAPAPALEYAIVAGALAFGSAATIIALRARAAVRACRLALRLAREREETFIDSSRRLADAARTGVDAIRDEIVRAARTIAPNIDGFLLYEECDGSLTCTFAAGERVAYFPGSRTALDEPGSLPARAIALGHRVTLGEGGVRPVHPGDVAALAVPLALEAGRTAVLVMAARAPLDRQSVDRLVTVVDHASPAYLLAREREDDRRRAEYDGLTGLLTPRAFRQRLSLLVERARFAPLARLALVFVDTDRFKEWNDAYGHACGDALLREIAGVLRSIAAADRDLVARNGGDEFCIVFTETDKATAIERADLLRRRIAAIDCSALRPDGARGEVRITASLGVAALAADAAGASELLECADAAMYHTKQTGRDGVSYVLPAGGFSRLAADREEEAVRPGRCVEGRA